MKATDFFGRIYADFRDGKASISISREVVAAFPGPEPLGFAVGTVSDERDKGTVLISCKVGPRLRYLS